MGVFDYSGSANEPDDAGAGTPAVPPPSSIPSVAAPSPAPPPAMPGQPPSVDPRLQAALAGLQPQQPVAPWKAALQKIAPILGAVLAMHNNAGGAFANEWQTIDKQNSERDDREAQRRERLATIIHQQQMEQHQAAMEKIAADRVTAAERAAASKADQTAKKEQEKEERANELSAFKALGSPGGVLEHANEIAQKDGKEAADRYLAGFHYGPLTEDGTRHSIKDLVDKYGVRDADTGEIALTKNKSVKETKAGTAEDYVQRARTMKERDLGRPLTDAEEQAVDEVALKRYKNLSKDPELTDLTKNLAQLRVDMANQEKERKQQIIDKGYQDQYGSSPQMFQHPDGSIHGYVYDKTNHKLVEIPVQLPEGSSRIQPPSAFQKFLKSIGLGDSGAPPPIKPLAGGGQDPTDPNWGR